MGTRDLKVLVVIMLANGDREYVQYYVHYHDIHWNPDIPDILWQYLYIHILAWCNYESWSSCRPCRYITSKQAWIEWCCTLGTSFTKNQQPTSNQPNHKRKQVTWCCYHEAWSKTKIGPCSVPTKHTTQRLALAWFVAKSIEASTSDFHESKFWFKALQQNQTSKPPNPKSASHFHHEMGFRQCF